MYKYANDAVIQANYMMGLKNILKRILGLMSISNCHLI